MFNKFLHKVLRLPFRLYVRNDRRVENEKVTIVFWHGIATSGKFWNKVIDTVSNSPDFDHARLITVDLLGFGRSPTPRWLDYTTDDYLRSLHRTLRSLHIKTPIILVGHSMGSLLAVEYAATYPDDSVIALALASPSFLQPAESQAMFDRFYRTAYDKLLTAAQIKQLKPTADFFDKITSFESNEARHKSFRMSMKHVVIGSRALTQIKKLRLPIHIFHGSLDVLVNGANIKPLTKRKNITLHTAPTGHDVVGPKKDQLIDTLVKLVKKQK